MMENAEHNENEMGHCVHLAKVRTKHFQRINK